jgi:two-component system, OmpR family, response regulator MtrA
MQKPLVAARQSSGIATADETATARFVEAWLRRQGLVAVPRTVRIEASSPDQIRVGMVVIDLARREVRVKDVEVRLTPTEFRLLRYLAERPERLAGRREILLAVWGPGYEDDIHLLHVTMRGLRARIALVTDRPVIETVYGTGYRIASFGAAQTRRSSD